MPIASAILTVLWSGFITFVQAALLAALLTGAFVLLLLPLGWTHRDLLWQLGFGAVALAQLLTPALMFLGLRRRPLYPLDALGLFLAPVAVPVAIAHLAREAFAFCFNLPLTRSADAMVMVVGCACAIVGSAPFARLFLLHVRWPSPTTRVP